MKAISWRLIATATTFIASTLFISTTNPELQSVIVLINLIFVSIIISYFMMTSTPNRQGRDEIVKNLNEIKDEVNKISVSETKLRKAGSNVTLSFIFRELLVVVVFVVCFSS